MQRAHLVDPMDCIGKLSDQVVNAVAEWSRERDHREDASVHDETPRKKT